MRVLKSHSSLYILLFLASLLFCIAGSVAAQPGGVGEVALVNPPQVDNDQISLDIVVKNASGLPVPNLTAQNFSLNEPAENIRLEAAASLPVALAVIVDLSSGSDVDLIQNALRAYVKDYYQAGDPFTFYILGPDQNTSTPQVIEPTSRDEITKLIDGLQTSTRFYSITNALAESLDKLRSLQAVNQPAHALYVGSFLNDPSEASQSTPFKLAGIPFHVVQAHRYRHPSTPALQSLAGNGGGLFADDLGGTSILEDSTAVNLVKIIYDSIAASRQVYTLSYRTLNQSIEARRTVTLTLSFSADAQVSTDFIYERSFLPPEVSIVSANLSPVRLPSRVGGNITFDLARQPVTVSVTFPDGVLRSVASLRLEILDANTGNTLQSSLQPAPDINESGNYVLNWALDDFSTPGTTTNVEVKVTASDELGLEGTASGQGSVTVGALPPPTLTPTPRPTATLVPTALPPTPAPTAIATTAGASTNPAFAVLQGSPVALQILIGVAGFLIALVLLLLILLIRARRQKAESEEELEELRAQPPVIMTAESADGAGGRGKKGEPEEEKTVYGRLIIIDGIEGDEILVNEEEFLIGRRAENGCHWVIDQPFISPRHCLITHRAGSFTVRDLNSKNGVFINGERIPRDREVIVPIGSEVAITERIKVELWDPNTVVNLETRRSGQTSVHHTTRINSAQADLAFRPLPGIQYAEDDGSDVDDNYSPI